MSKDSDKITLISNKTIVDYVTGEIVEEEKTTKIRKSTEPNYIKLYINTLLAFKDLPKTLNPILIELLGYMTYADSNSETGGQLIVVNGYIKQQIGKKLDMKINTIEKAMAVLCKKDILKRLGIGTYQVNPYMFGKGEWKDISAIRATFDFNTGEMKADIEKIME